MGAATKKEVSGVRKLPAGANRRAPVKKAVKKAPPKNKKVAPKPVPRNVRKPLDPDKMGVVDQIVHICTKQGSGKKASRKHLAAAVLGGVLGGFVPIATYTLAHIELAGVAWYSLWAQLSTWLVIGGLLYSAPTVYNWANKAFGGSTFIGRTKSFGFVLLIEGSMIAGKGHWALVALGIAALGVLVFVNGVASGCKLALQRTA